MRENRAPPQLMFDDGSRAMTEESSMPTTSNESPESIRGSIPLEVYYEIDRISSEILALFPNVPKAAQEDNTEEKDINNTLRVALQFPDELLSDSPDVCWLLDEKLQSVNPLVFCLGDTTVGSCCPDEVAALHLQADILVHYGHACLSPTGTLPVLYSFGMLDIDIPFAVNTITKQQEASDGELSRKFLLLYQVGYHHAVEDLQTQLSEKGDILVVAAQIPAPSVQERGDKRLLVTKTSGSCCGGNSGGQESCCNDTGTANTSTVSNENCEKPETAPCDRKDDSAETQKKQLIVGGLELPESFLSWEQLQDYTILFIGDPESTSQRQYVNIMLHFLSLPSPPQAYWTYSPKLKELNTEVPTNLNRQLKRRFFLTQKARDAHVFGILVSNLSQQHLIQVVKSLKRRIQDAGKASYSFSVGKINPNKLANFAEIECFVLVACREHSLLGDIEREYHVPVITPLELDIALGNLIWGGQAYSLDCQDVLQHEKSAAEDEAEEVDKEDDSVGSDEDAPYFSLVTGKYVQRTAASSEPTPLDLENLPGKGQVASYKSEAANFLKQREYQGLATLAGQTEAKAAVQGQRGIASNYEGS